MKIGILTHPFRGNYGGMLQAYALFQILRRIGHEAVILDFQHRRLPSFRKSPIAHIRARLNLKKRIKFLLIWLLHRPEYYSYKNGRRFHQKYVQGVKLGSTPATQLEKHGIEAVVVGSAQVWRAVYARDLGSLPFFFLDFAPESIRRRSIAYAASIGTDTWEGNEEETRLCRQLLQEFRAVSVREDSGINICHQILGTNATRMADPTLLLTTDDYSHLIQQEDTHSPTSPYVASYVLDNSPGIEETIHAVVHSRQHLVQPLNATPQAGKRSERYPISVPQWLRYIRDCEYLITDSFHGCVFSIIFNKPFICLGNERRGSARFYSLLGTFGLQNRLVTNHDKNTLLQLLNTPIDWERVNSIRQSEQKRAIAFLKENLLP